MRNIRGRRSPLDALELIHPVSMSLDGLSLWLAQLVIKSLQFFLCSQSLVQEVGVRFQVGAIERYQRFDPDMVGKKLAKTSRLAYALVRSE